MKDLYNHKDRYNHLLNQIQTFNPKRRREFSRFHKYMITRELSLARKITLLNNLKAFFKTEDIKPTTRINIYNIIQKIDRINKSPNTKRDYKLAYRSYLKSIGTDEKLIELIAVGNPDIRKPKKIIDKPLYPYMNSKDEQLFVRLLQETGARPGEIMNIRHKHIEFTDFGAYLTITGKTGTRTIPIIDTVPMLQENRKTAKNQEDYMFWFTYGHISKQVAKMLKKQGYEDTYMYLFRKSKATELFETLPEQLVKKYMGWSKNSKMAKVYSFPRQEKLTDAIIQMNQARGIPKKMQTNLNNWGA